MTLVITWSGFGLGMGESTILTVGPLETIASFIVLAERFGCERDNCEEMEERRWEACFCRFESIWESFCRFTLYLRLTVTL